MKTTEYKKDYSLLRPFNLEAAKRNEPFCSKLRYLQERDNSPLTFISGPDTTDRICANNKSGILDLYHTSTLCMAPLCWIEGRPVYKGDVLYTTCNNPDGASIKKYCEFVVESYPKDQPTNRPYLMGNDVWSVSICYLTWPHQKQKREGWYVTHKDYLVSKDVAKEQVKRFPNCVALYTIWEE
jgi:hypothetical protein